MRNSAADGSLKLTDEEIKMGWTLESLSAYQAERDRATSNLIPGNVVTSMVRSRPPLVVENCTKFNPHGYWRR